MIKSSYANYTNLVYFECARKRILFGQFCVQAKRPIRTVVGPKDERVTCYSDVGFESRLIQVVQECSIPCFRKILKISNQQ